MFKKSLIFFILLQIVHCSFGSDPKVGDTFDVPNALKGKVVQKDGRAIIDAKVEILSVSINSQGDSTEIVYSAISDKNGEFVIDNYLSGTYSIFSCKEELCYLDSKQLIKSSGDDSCVVVISERVTIKGRVVGEYDNVKVSIAGHNRVVDLDSDGFYEFKDVAKGVYDIAFIRGSERVDYLALSTKNVDESIVYVKDVRLSDQQKLPYDNYDSEISGFEITVESYEEGDEPSWYSEVEFKDIYFAFTVGRDHFTFSGKGYEETVNGFASYSSNGIETTTGGDFSQAVFVSTRDELVEYCSKFEPLVIIINDEITCDNREMINVTSNKTIMGGTTDASLMNGGFNVVNASNIIIKNITISGSADDSIWDDDNNSIDGITVDGSNHVWIDHCTFSKIGDGAIDIVNQSSYVTISNSLFKETNKVILIGADNYEETTDDDYNVSLYKNHFKGTLQGHARARYGKVHIYNNFYDSLSSYNKSIGIDGDGYGIGIGVDVEILSENNLFNGVIKCSKDYDSDEQNGILVDFGSQLIDSKQFEQDSVAIWDASSYYSYSLKEAIELEALLEDNSGSGHYIIK